jgi:hypothetical protein
VNSRALLPAEPLCQKIIHPSASRSAFANSQEKIACVFNAAKTSNPFPKGKTLELGGVSLQISHKRNPTAIQLASNGSYFGLSLDYTALRRCLKRIGLRPAKPASGRSFLAKTAASA